MAKPINCTEIPFKEGDKVKILRNCSGAEKGKTYVLQYGSENGCEEDFLFAGGLCSCHQNWKLVPNYWDE